MRGVDRPSTLTANSDGEHASDVWVYLKVAKPSVRSGLMISIGNVSSVFRWLRLWDGPRPAIGTPPRSPPPAPPLPPRPMITYDKGFPSLPDDIISEVFNVLDLETLKSCSLTGKALSYLAKPFIHQTLHLTSRPKAPTKSIAHSRRNEFEGLSTLAERGLLRHIRHISIILPSSPLFAHSLDPYIQHLHTLTNLRSFKARWLDTPSFIPKMEEYFGAFLGSLRSLELEFPRGDHQQIFYFICQFPNLRDLKINSVPGRTNSMSNDGPRFDIKTSPPLDGTLDLRLNMDMGPESNLMGAQLILSSLATLPSGLRIRTLKFSWCTGDNLQLVIDACAPTLECVEFTGQWFGASSLHRAEFL